MYKICCMSFNAAVTIYIKKIVKGPCYSLLGHFVAGFMGTKMPNDTNNVHNVIMNHIYINHINHIYI